MNLAEIRQKYPQYDNIPDGDLATRLHQKFYPQLTFEDFSSRIGYSPEPAQPEPTVIDRAIDAIANSGKIGMPNLPAGESLPPAPDEVAGLPQIVFPKPSLPQSLPSMATAEPMPTPGPKVTDTLTSSHIPTVPVVPAHATQPPTSPALAIPGEAELELGRALQNVPKWHGGDIGELGAGVLGYMLQRAAAGLGFLAHGAGSAEAGPFVQTPKPTLAELAKEAQRTTEMLAHQPPTVEGIYGKTQEEPGAIAKAVSYPFEKAKEYAERASQWVYDNTGSAWLSGLTAAGDELLLAAMPFMKRLRGGPGKGVVPVDSTEFGEGLSEGARLRKLAKDDPAAFRAAFEEALKKRMNPAETQPEAPGEAQAAKPAETMGEHFGPQAEAQAPPPVKFANAPRGTAADLPNMPLADLDKVPMEQRVKLMFPDLSDAEAKQVADSIQAQVTETIENAPPLRADQGSPPMGEGLGGGRGPGEGGEDLQRHPEAGGAAAFIEPPRGEAPTRTQPRTEIARPGGNGDRIKAAYDALKAERGVENIEIADIRDRAGASQAEIEAYLKRQAEAGKAVTTTGDFSVADEHTRSGAVRLSRPDRPDLLARLDEAQEQPASVPQEETEPALKAAQAKEPWQMTRDQYRSAMLEGWIPDGWNRGTREAMDRHMEETGKEVVRKVGTKDLQKITDHYANKYDLKVGFEYGVVPGNTDGDALMGAGKIDGKAVIVVNPNNIKGHTPFQLAAMLRHEIEHIKDQTDGFKGSRSYAWGYIDNYYNKGPAGHAWGQALQGHHKYYQYFETDYLHRSTVKRAIKEGKPVPPEVLAEYPELSKVQQPETQPNGKTGAEPKQAPKAEVKQAGHVERLRATANRIKLAAEEKFNATRNENTPRRARIAEDARNEAAARIAQAETMLRIADGIEAGELKALAGVSQAEIEAYLRKQAEAGKAVTTTGDFSVADEHTRSGAVTLSNPERPDLLARLDEAEDRADRLNLANEPGTVKIVAMKSPKGPGDITTSATPGGPNGGEIITQLDTKEFVGEDGNKYIGKDASEALSLISDKEFKDVTGFTKDDFSSRGGSVYFIPAKEIEANSIHELSGEIVLSDALLNDHEKLKKKLIHELTHWGGIQRGETPKSYFVSPEKSIKKFMEYYSDPEEVRARFNEEGRSQKEYDEFIEELNWSKSDDAAKFKMPEIGETKVENIESWRPSLSYIQKEVSNAKKGLYRDIPKNQLERDINELSKILPEKQRQAVINIDDINYQLDTVASRKPVSDEDASNVNVLYSRIKYEWQMNRLGVGKKRLTDADIEYINQPTLRMEVIGKLDVSTGKREKINPILLESFLRENAGITAFATGPNEIQIKLTKSNIEKIKKLNQIFRKVELQPLPNSTTPPGKAGTDDVPTAPKAQPQGAPAAAAKQETEVKPKAETPKAQPAAPEQQKPKTAEPAETAQATVEKADAETAPAGAASKGRYATDELAGRDLSKVEVSVKYQTDDGESVTVKQPASEALKAIDEQTERMKALQKCLEGA